MTRRAAKRHFFLLANDAPQVGVPLRIGALHVDDGDIRVGGPAR